MARKEGATRGFASMDSSEQKKIAAQGGRAAHASGNAHQFTSEEARAAGRKRHENAKARKDAAQRELEVGSTG